jgi:hypothetical protein
MSPLCAKQRVMENEFTRAGSRHTNKQNGQVKKSTDAIGVENGISVATKKAIVTIAFFFFIFYFSLTSYALESF